MYKITVIVSFEPLVPFALALYTVPYSPSPTKKQGKSYSWGAKYCNNTLW